MDTEDTIKWIIGVVLLIASLGFTAVIPHFEARAFNECTGGNATYMTALFTELRVENCNK